jgi:hypothetical protein
VCVFVQGDSDVSSDTDSDLDDEEEDDDEEEVGGAAEDDEMEQ